MYGASIYYLDKVPTPTVLKKALAQIKPTCMLSVPLVIEKIFKSSIQPKFEANALIKYLYKNPFMRKKINRKAGQKMLEIFGGELRFFGIGGAAISTHVEAFLIEANFPFVVGYGLSETSPIVAGAPLKKRKYRSTGPTIDGMEAKLTDVNPETGEGELIVRGTSVMLGYYNDEKASSEALDKDGWFKTGDLARIDEDGYIFIQGRSKNMILGSSGENIYPEQIESIIDSFEMVVDSLVYDKAGKLGAKVNLDYEKLDHTHAKEILSESEEKQLILDKLEELRAQTNKQMSKFSKLTFFEEQQEPFEKTPTKKIKRFLYI